MTERGGRETYSVRDPLEVQPWQSVHHASAFDPRTLILTVNNVDLLDMQFDDIYIDTDLSGGEDEKPMWYADLKGRAVHTYRQTAMHEYAHWWQYCGTTFGNFLLFLRHTNIRLAVQSFSTLSPPQKKKLLKL